MNESNQYSVYVILICKAMARILYITLNSSVQHFTLMQIEYYEILYSFCKFMYAK